MLFSKVTLENIKTAVNDFNQKGTPDGFSTSKYYDIKIEGILYPPKPIMAIANFYATGRKVENYFPGGINTPCFKCYERLGVEIITKSSRMLNESLFKNHFEDVQRHQNNRNFHRASLSI
jgi:5-methylcytosine-specific restriction protein B